MSKKINLILTLLILSVSLIIICGTMIQFAPEIKVESPKPIKPDVYTSVNDSINKLDLGAFYLNAPIDFEYIKKTGIDSYVGEIAGKKDTLYFDYGWYSSDFQNSSGILSYDTINGNKVIFAKLKNGFGVHFPKTNISDNKLSIYAKSGNENKIIEIFKSIRFDSSKGHTSKELGTNINNGQELFRGNCNTCHNLDNDSIGPKLKGVAKEKGREWFKGWVLNPEKLIKTNVKALELFKKHDEFGHIFKYPFSEEEVDQLIDYIEFN
ncbi:c-type cytochrome [Marinigracilibium pacificum]|uniref:Cytochrome c n=1 Tax=Marinigracilibium pacificum TaxID=2729599 RepID=A0A848J942_9BACT|nr:cytochrome c [Marinigracilibium pacificum]NMM50899.1 cytochrome c [Marinigracilibium pacificum]